MITWWELAYLLMVSMACWKQELSMFISRVRMWACSSVTDIAVLSFALLQLITRPPSKLRQSLRERERESNTLTLDIKLLQPTSWLRERISTFLSFLVWTWALSCSNSWVAFWHFLVRAEPAVGNGHQICLSTPGLDLHQHTCCSKAIFESCEICCELLQTSHVDLILKCAIPKSEWAGLVGGACY